MRGVGTVDWSQAFGAWRDTDPADPTDPRMAGSYIYFSLRLAAPGPLGAVQAQDLAGLSWVAVHPDHRRRGVLSRLIAHHHEDLRERGIAWSGLHASETSIYGRFGYAPASLNVEYMLKRGTELRAPAAVPAAADAIDVHTVFDIDEATAARLRRISVETEAGALGTVTWPEPKELAFLRDNPSERRGRGIEPSRVLIASTATGAADGDGRSDGRTDGGGRREVGFAVYRRTDSWEQGLPGGTVDVRSLRAKDPATLLALGRRLADMDLMAGAKLSDRGLDDPLLWWSGGPRSVGAATYDGLWPRPVDVGAALASGATSARSMSCSTSSTTRARGTPGRGGSPSARTASARASGRARRPTPGSTCARSVPPSSGCAGSPRSPRPARSRSTPPGRSPR